MRDDTSTPEPARLGPSLAGAILAAAGALAMGAVLASMQRTARSAQGEDALISWVLIGLAGLGVLLCLYLALIWGLATAILVIGPATRSGTALLGALRILAPRLARRLATGAAVATAATALTFTSGMASQNTQTSEPAPEPVPIAQTAELVSTEGPSTDPAPEAAAQDGEDVSGQAEPVAPLPPLGWGDDSPSAAAATEQGDDHKGGDGQHAGAATSERSPRTVVVLPGDSLWSISDDLLGPGTSDAAEIAEAWPLLHHANRDLIGQDPDQLRPGQELTVPASLIPQDTP
ncbi:LysM domain-containing protein [Brachybacterium sp.]|uniref:LysM peptidoglycan-binding domain-containing protein n=1 Tax=Brachybacterium sp. TaxID=1891286 RepID=UPI002ED54A1C